MILHSNVNRKHTLSWWHFIILFLLFSGFIFVFFPKKVFIDSLLNTEKPSLVSVGYLKNMVARHPERLDWKLLLGEQLFAINALTEAKQLVLPWVKIPPSTKFQWQALWLYYRIVRVETNALKPSNPARLQKLRSLKFFAETLANSPYLNEKSKFMLANDALAMNLPKIANRLYQKTLSTTNKNYTPQIFEKAGMTALFSKDYEHASKFYLEAMKQSDTLINKRRYFFKAIDSLLRSGSAKKAFEMAEKNIDGLKEDKATNVMMAKLALNAGEQKVAENYVNFLMKIRYQDLDK